MVAGARHEPVDFGADEGGRKAVECPIVESGHGTIQIRGGYRDDGKLWPSGVDLLDGALSSRWMMSDLQNQRVRNLLRESSDEVRTIGQETRPEGGVRQSRP